MELNLGEVRERLLHNNELYIISWGKQVSIIIEEGLVYEESLCLEDRHALNMYKNSEHIEQDVVDKEEEPYCRVDNDDHTMDVNKQDALVKGVRVECERCTKTFRQRSYLKRHMREVHENQRLHRCNTCSKAYNRRWTKNRHAEKCKGDASKIEMLTYTFPSTIRGYHIYRKNWTPHLGDILPCMREEDNEYTATAIAIMSNTNQVVGHVPRNLSSAFTEFLVSPNVTTIDAKVVGSVIDCGYGLEIPVEYIFHGNRSDLSELLKNIEKGY